MRIKKILVTVVATIVALSCQQNQKKKLSNSKAKTKVDTALSLENKPNTTDTSIVSYSNAAAKNMQRKIEEIDSIASLSKKIEAQITLDEIKNTPVTVWYDKYKLPIKAEYGVTDDAGEFTDKFILYFSNGKLVCSDWILAKFIFDSNGKLIYWLNESWEISETEATAGPYFKEKEEMNLNTVEELLSKVALK